jgi:EAL domain-containing protein (putative c-di-GMP-specific phosphodiesterase class I)/GGDEF domain-containing protein
MSTEQSKHERKIIDNKKSEFLNRINKIKKIDKSCFVACLDIIEFRMINNIQGYDTGDYIIEETLNHIYRMVEVIGVDIDACVYEKDAFMMIIYTDREDVVNKFIREITMNKLSYNFRFRTAYMQVNEKIDIDIFLDNVSKVIRSEKFSLISSASFESKFDGTLNIKSEIEKYNQLKKEILGYEMPHFKIVYQPQVDLQDEIIMSCEVLTRWNHPTLGNLPPLEFLKVVRDLDKEYEFDLLVLNLLCTDIEKMDIDLELYSINMSVNTISKKESCEEIMKILNKHNIDPKKITIEILENADAIDSPYFLDNVEKLSKMGFTISIDDFGSGYASYFRISSFNFSEVKIPREFIVDNRIENEKNMKILESLVNMCKELGCKVVSEGIETEADLNAIKNLGVDYAQGYLYSKPLELEKFLDFVKKFNLEVKK